MQTNIVRIKYEDKYVPKTFGGKAYSYYSAVELEVGDLIIAPTSSGDKIARVSEINVPEDRILMIKPYLKLITEKIDKNTYLQTNQILRVA